MAVRARSRACVRAVRVSGGIGGAIARGRGLVAAGAGMGAEAQDAGDSVPNRSLVFTVVHPYPTFCWG